MYDFLVTTRKKLAISAIKKNLVQLLLKVSRPSKIILFGSAVSGTISRNSDLDILVVEKNVPNRLSETVRLRRALRPLRMSIDLLVVSQNTFDYWSDTPGTVYFEAASEGKVLYEEKAA